MAKLFANSEDPDQKPHSAASDLGLHCLPITPLRVSRLQWVKGPDQSENAQTDLGFCCSDILKEPFSHSSNHLFFRVLTFVLLIALACCPNVRRSYPTNFILLSLFVS